MIEKDNKEYFDKNELFYSVNLFEFALHFHKTKIMVLRSNKIGRLKLNNFCHAFWWKCLVN